MLQSYHTLSKATIFLLLFFLVTTIGLNAATKDTSNLPIHIKNALKKANIPTHSLGVMVSKLEHNKNNLGSQALIALHVNEERNPASVMKLVTAFAALDLLGPDYQWKTSIYMDGNIEAGTLFGNLYIKGGADPSLTVERLWLILYQVQQLGIKNIKGDMILDQSVIQTPEQAPEDFDNKPLEPYNAIPEALLISFDSLLIRFLLLPKTDFATVSVIPRITGLEIQKRVKLNQRKCGNWQQGLRATTHSSTELRFLGTYPKACGNRTWPLAFVDHSHYAQRAIHQMWLDSGGTLSGGIRNGQVPDGALPVMLFDSPSLTRVITDINKYSNNVMARLLFLSFSLDSQGIGSLKGSQDIFKRWWSLRFPKQQLPVIDNGAGLSLQSRITPAALNQLLQSAYQSHYMPELLASLPIVGVDGTLADSRAKRGSAHLKTGSMPRTGIYALAGYVDGASGHRYAFSAIVNHPNAIAAVPVFDKLVEWVHMQ